MYVTSPAVACVADVLEPGGPPKICSALQAVAQDADFEHHVLRLNVTAHGVSRGAGSVGVDASGDLMLQLAQARKLQIKELTQIPVATAGMLLSQSSPAEGWTALAVLKHQ